MPTFFGIALSSPAETSSTEDSLRVAQQQVFGFLRPKPSPVPLIRIGGNRDGAYLLPDDLDGIEACFSPGVNNIKHFEDELLERFGIMSHMCDFTSDAARLATPLAEGRQTFQKKWLDLPGTPDAITLEDWVRDLAPGSADLLLQMDIEGAEYRNLLDAPPEVLRRFRVIVMELHGLKKLNDPGAMATVFLPLFDKLGADFDCVHAHPNNCASAIHLAPLDVQVPPTLELTLLRKDRVSAVDSTRRVAPQIPHPLDIVRNVRLKPPLFLGPAWYDEQPPQSRIAQLEAELDYARESVEVHDAHASAVTEAFALLAYSHELVMLTPDVTEAEEIAQGKRFLVHAGAGLPQRQGVVKQRSPFFCHSPMMQAPRITLDLESSWRIVRITVANRTNGWTQRMRGLMVILHDDPDPDSGFGFAMPLSDDFLAGRQLEAELQLPALAARHLTFTTPLRTALHFSDVRVYALPQDSCSAEKTGPTQKEQQD